jgi:hypothetical protein
MQLLMRFSGVFSKLVLALFAVHLGVSLNQAAHVSAATARMAWRLRGEPPSEERSHAYGPEYVRALAEIRRTIPPDGAYVLISAVSEAEGAAYWVKFDLAPRRAVYLGELGSLQPVERLRKRMPRAARWVVIAYGSYRPPVVLERFRFIRERKRLEGA